jgi:hypothetical protein
LRKKELILSEDQARRLWERAAQLQAEASQREEDAEEDPASEDPRRQLLPGVEDETSGYSLTHIREAGEEIGIGRDFLDLALAEEAILELEGGGGSGFWDRSSEVFLDDKGRTFEIRRRFPFQGRRVWLALEDAFTSASQRLELLEVRGGEPFRGGVAIFEAPYAYQKTGSLQYWATVAEVRRFMVRVVPEGEEECVVIVSAPLRRARRVNGAVGMLLSGIGGALGGGVGIGIAGLVVGSGGRAAGPVALGLTAGGVFGGQRISRMGYIRLYRWGCRALEKAFHRIFTRVERDVQRDLEALPPPEA